MVREVSVHAPISDASHTRTSVATRLVLLGSGTRRWKVGLRYSRVSFLQSFSECGREHISVVPFVERKSPEMGALLVRWFTGVTRRHA